MTSTELTVADLEWSDYDFIDMGAGTGGSLLSARKRIGGRGLGLETDADKVMTARLDGLEVVEADLFSLPREARVRYVVFDNVLEHLPDLDAVAAALEVAQRTAAQFIYIRHPSFDDEAYLASLGLKQYWTDWTGHPAHILLCQYMRIFREIGIVGSTFHPVRRATDSTDATILPLDTPPDQFRYEAGLHGPKPLVIFDRPVYEAYDIVALTTPGRIELDYRWDPETLLRHPYVHVEPAAPVTPVIASSGSVDREQSGYHLPAADEHRFGNEERNDMYRFWEPVVGPLLEIHKPEVIVEIGSDLGYNTLNLLDFCRRTGATLHAIDPLPKFDVDAWEHEYKEELTLHRLPSLEALPQLPDADAVLIDGDHNWHTVFHELKTLEEVAQLHGGNFPLVFLHDIGWPYGRRDLYYEPDRIPEPHRHPYRLAGLRPSRRDVDTTGGLNTHLYNALEEGGPRNGVLTAIEDFLEQTTLDLELVTVPGIHDLGILISVALRTQDAALSQFLEELTASPTLREVTRQVEALRVAAIIDRADQLKELKAARTCIAETQEQFDSARKSVEADKEENGLKVKKNRLKVIQLEVRNKSLGQDRAHIHAQSNRLRGELASLKNTERQLRDEVDALTKSLANEQDARRKSASQLQRLRNRRVVRTALRVAKLAKPFIGLWRRARRLRSRPPRSSGESVPQVKETARAMAADLAAIRSEIATADIVVCVHNAEDDVRNCLESIVETTNLTTHGLIVVDDGSDAPVKMMLEEFASRNPGQLIRNETALGYTVAANQGISVSERPHVVLLNSDTVVTPGWLEKLIHCAEVMPDAGIVGPYSNAASWQSLPELTNPNGSWHLNPLPEGVTPADIAAEISRWSPRIYPEVPLVNGFCYLITRSALDQVGKLDEQSFPRGYGEEDDFSIRCSDLGLKLYIADDCYVYHAKSRSHTPEGRKKIVRENKVVLQRKHGAEAVTERVDQIRLDEGLIRSRKFVSGAIAHGNGRASPPTITGSPLVGWLQPHLEEAGGIRRAIEMTNRLARWGCESVIIAPDGWKSSWLPILSKVVSVDEARSMSFDHLILSDPDILWPFQEIEATHRVVYHLAPYMLYRTDDETLKAYYESTKDSLHVANSKWTAEQVEAYSGLTIEGVFPGGVDKRLFHPMRAERTHDVVCHGSNRRHKGTDTIEEAASGLRLLKMDTRNAPQRHLARLINSGQVFVSAAWHEGFNLAALEAMACGVPVVMTDDGGSREYAVDGDNALVVEPRHPSALRERILELQKDKSLRARLIEGGLETVWQYSWDAVTTDFADLVFAS